jgi:hypothetical protein
MIERVSPLRAASLTLGPDPMAHVMGYRSFAAPRLTLRSKVLDQSFLQFVAKATTS